MYIIFTFLCFTLFQGAVVVVIVVSWIYNYLCNQWLSPLMLTFFLLHCDEWDRVVALPRHKFVTGATLLQLEETGPGENHRPVASHWQTLSPVMYIIFTFLCFTLFQGAVVVVIVVSWIYNYLCNQWLSPLMLWVWISIRARCTR
jgi:hypothetical protein